MPVSLAKPGGFSLFELGQERAYALRVSADVRSRKGRYNPQPGQLTAEGIAALPSCVGERHTGLIPRGNYLGGTGAASWVEDLQVILAGPGPVVMPGYGHTQGKLNDPCRQFLVRILCG